MNTIPEEQDMEIIALVEKLREAPERLPQDLVTGKAKFLAEAQSYPRPVVPGLNGRDKEKSFFPRKVHPKLAFIPILIAIFMLIVFAGTGVTVYAAQSSLPDQPLYSVKLASEDIRSNLPASSQTRVDLAMDFADVRLQEALQLAAQGKPIPNALWERMENHIDFGLLTAAGMDDQQLLQQLLTIQSRLQLELDHVSVLGTDSRYSDTVEGIRAALLTRLQLVTIGLNDPAAFRQYLQMDQNHPELLPLPTASPTSTSTAVPAATATPQPPQPTRTSASKMTSTPWQSMMTPWSQSTQQWGGHSGPTQAPTHSWNNNNDCHDCGGWNNGGWSGGGSGGHDGGGGGGWHH